MTDQGQREMTLEEWVRRLPGKHRAVRDYNSLVGANDALRFAARGGTASRDTADLLTFLADRLVATHHEDEATDYVRAAYERARMLRSALEDAR